MLKKFLQNIFSVRNQNIHKVWTIFGIKFKFQNDKLFFLSKINTLFEEYNLSIKEQINTSLNNYASRFLDVRQIPKATGAVRKCQILDTEILNILHKIFEKYNLRYWLDFGTLLGAIRHNGFVPWDDDMDIGMLRDDYNKLFEILDKEFINTDLFYYGKYETFNHCWDTFIRIRLKNTSLNIDIFPYDLYYKDVQTEAERKTLEEDMIKGREFYNNHFPIKGEENEEKLKTLRELFGNYTKKYICKNQNCIEDNRPTIFKGIENWAYYKPFYYSYNTIFPLTKIKFEKYEFYIPAKYDVYLTNIYGDYMKLPNDVDRHGSVFIQDIPVDIDELMQKLAMWRENV